MSESNSSTISAAAGPNTLAACGRGLAGTDNNGPRADVVDPFQPIQAAFDEPDPVGDPVEVPVLTGSVVFTATGSNDIEVLPFGSTFEFP